MTSILVIDDEYGVRSGIRQILELEGFEVAEASTGREALALLANRAYDVTLIDYQLPDIDGLTLLGSIRSRKLSTMTCMITAYANIDTAIAATRQGIDFFLPKPFSPDDLLGVIETLARHKRLKEEAEELRRKNEASLRALATEKSQTSSLVASLRDAVLVINREGEVVLVNHAMASLLGRDAAALVRTPVAQVLSGPALAPLGELLATPGEGRKPTEVTLEDNVYVARVVAFHGDDGETLGRILTLADVTPLRRMAMEKPRFIRTMVHEFRSPLGSIRSLIEVATEKTLGGDLAPYVPFLERANHRIDRLVELIGDLLSLSRIDLERAPGATEEPGDVTTAVASAVELHRSGLDDKHIELRVELAPELARVRMSTDDLRSVLGNLLGNAIKYGRENGKVRIASAQDGDDIRIAVEDSGIGIAPENLANVFAEFFREKRGETRDIEGNGLGLAIVKRLAERAGGRAEVQSQLGVGSSFAVIVPIA